MPPKTLNEASANPTREELRAKLRAKLGKQREGRTGGTGESSQAQTRQAAENALLNLAGENAEMFNLAQSVLKNPKSASKMLSDLKGSEVGKGGEVNESSDEEEGPPPIG